MANALLFELVVILVSIILYYCLKKIGYKNVGKRFIFLFIGIFLFEIMAEPMWINKGLDSWAYVYGNVSWILTLGWLDIFLVSMLIVDKLCNKTAEKVKFWWYLVVVTIITTPIESWLLNSGLRAYDSALTTTFSGILIPLTSVPIEIMLAVPIIAALVIPFYKVSIEGYGK